MQQKSYNIELLRAMSFVMVIIIHVANYFCRAYEFISIGEYLFSLTLNTLSRVSVPCFFMISGVLLLGRNETMKKSLQRAFRFFIVLVVWTIIYYVFNTYYMNQPVDLKKLAEIPAEAHLWYLYVMIPIYLVLPFLQAMCRGMNAKLEKAFVILGGILVLLQPIMFYAKINLYFGVPIFGDRVYIYYLFLGYFIAKYKDRIPEMKRLWSGIFFGSSLITVITTTIGSSIMGYHMEQLLTYGCPLILLSSVSFFIMVLQSGNGNLQLKEPVRKAIDICCGCSFGIYLIHILLLDNFKKYVKAYEVSAYWAIPALVIGILGVSLLIVYLIRKTAIGRKIS